MRRRWIHETASGQRLEYRLPWWLPPYFRLLGVLGALRHRVPDDAEVERLMQAQAWVRRLPDGPWRRWRDLPDRPDRPA